MHTYLYENVFIIKLDQYKVYVTTIRFNILYIVTPRKIYITPPYYEQNVHGNV